MHPVKYDEWLKIKEFIPKNDVWIDKGGEYFKKSQYASEYKLDEVLIDGNVIWAPNYVIKSPRECKSIIVDPKDLKYRVLIIHKDKGELAGTNVLKYIEWGEEQGFHKRPTCASRQRWYELSEVTGQIYWVKSVDITHFTPFSPMKLFIDQRVYSLSVKEGVPLEVIVAFLNSSIHFLIKELYGRVNLGEGALDTAVYEIPQYPVITPKLNEKVHGQIVVALSKLSKCNISSIFEELGTDNKEEFSLDGIRQNRKELDKIFFDIINLNDSEQTEVYKSILDLVKSRVEKAEIAGKRGKKKGIDLKAFAKNIVNRLTTRIQKFPDEYVKNCKDGNTLRLSEGRLNIGSDIDGFYVQINGVEIFRSRNQAEAKYVYFAALTGAKSVIIPKDKKTVEDAVKKFEKDYQELRVEVSKIIETSVPDVKIRKQVEDIVWKLIFQNIRAGE